MQFFLPQWKILDYFYVPALYGLFQDHLLLLGVLSTRLRLQTVDSLTVFQTENYCLQSKT